ncbi:hypothetical protein C8Q69DRAFT_211537 [Paecilomyces variotii]|uniref:FAD-binding PCMH-type domain-containing protein n=1 Tax=Byssochlamys spectabilis TaxID=264951 RepID=A0A443HYY7_BYSSP|nr:hypothetical protein C8Q69DRAFT_211537 [Paecilomyces variotii]KAJ9245257.1 CAZyme family AA7 [Paecilomyces variotii]KAJ9314350.1 CAZyme family AA7 [Paecilomyces variotii]KAJ9357619.1 CAZyme family AA7 [Paecilomyces variotii]KAJ9362668.1 CAZyme family AA7 [Paecilomyces variotii]KAJ9389912.1 CAZyme family AA7 [Paecilomyces variotii]
MARYQLSLIIPALVAILAVVSSLSPSPKCKCFPGDSCWPTPHQWNSLNRTVGGRLIATVPLGQPCHDPFYDAEVCSSLQSQWQEAPIHMESSSSVMAPFFANQSCDPFTKESKPCLPGNYVRYAVNATSVEDIIATVTFAKSKNIRFVIRNTGHDYLGRSTGAGSLAIWTHYLKNISFLDWDDPYYKGRSVKVGAGVQGYEAMAATKAQGLVLVGGECPTVGIAGGYAQGGGHSILSTKFGLAADNTLSFDVVTADGKFVTASRTQNQDLYWALSGGGPGNYGVVVAVTFKAHPDTHFGGASLTFYADSNPTDIFYQGIYAFHEKLPAIIDAGAMAVYFFDSTFFSIASLSLYNGTQEEVKSLLAPFVVQLSSLGIKYNVTYGESTTYWDHYNKYFGPLPYGNIQVGIAQYGGRLIPRSVVANISSTYRSIAEQGVTFIGVGVDVSAFGKSQENSVLPAWRNAIVHATLSTPWNFTAPWSEMIARQDLMTHKIMPEIEAATPNSGAYMNEADFRQPNFQQVFFGSNYEKLKKIKQRWDKDGFFYATKSVGSEAWTILKDGRMCAT